MLLVVKRVAASPETQNSCYPLLCLWHERQAIFPFHCSPCKEEDILGFRHAIFVNDNGCSGWWMGGCRQGYRTWAVAHRKDGASKAARGKRMWMYRRILSFIDANLLIRLNNRRSMANSTPEIRTYCFALQSRRRKANNNILNWFGALAVVTFTIFAKADSDDAPNKMFLMLSCF